MDHLFFLKFLKTGKIIRVLAKLFSRGLHRVRRVKDQNEGRECNGGEWTQERGGEGLLKPEEWAGEEETRMFWVN